MLDRMSDDGEDDSNSSGCITALQIVLAFLLLLPIACCAIINSKQLADGFPNGIKYDDILVYESASGVLEGCVFIAYRLSDESAYGLASGTLPIASVQLGRKNTRNPYTGFRPTPLLLSDHHRYMDESGEHFLFALGASGGCEDNGSSQPSAGKLLSERGNYFAVSQNGEGLSIISPGRKMVLFLYFG